MTRPIEPPHSIQLDWVQAVIFSPRAIFPRIAAQTRSIWQTPILILSITAILYVLVSGPIRKASSQSAALPLNPEMGYSEEQMAQFQKAAETQQGPVFIYIFPGLVALGKVWLGWLVVGGVLHLVLTLLGGRGSTSVTMNLVAWASLPFAIRDGVRIVAMLATHQMVANPGLAGFAPVGQGNLNAYLTSLLGLVDIYIIWHAALLMMGVRSANGLARGKAILGVLITILLTVGFQASFGLLSSVLGGISVARPFFPF